MQRSPLPCPSRPTRAGALLLSLALVACAPSLSPEAQAALPGAAGPSGAKLAVQTRTVAQGLSHPWGLAFLPDGTMLVTERGGTLKRVTAEGKVSAISGVPAVQARSQGGLLDVAVDPEFGKTPWVYLSYSEPGSGAESGLAGTAVARARLQGQQLVDMQVIFRQTPKVRGAGHFGSRLVFARDGTLFVTLGERMQDSPSSPGTDFAQNLQTTLGKVVRLHRDGRIPSDNPTWSTPALPTIWSTGHRNPQGAALHPDTGELWVVEHGPQGGDELNRALAGRNFGWPLRSYGCPYGSVGGNEGCRVRGGTHAPAFTEPVSTWVPSVSPSGLAFYTGDRYPGWKGSLFTGALSGRALWRLVLRDGQVVSREPLLQDLGERIRDVRQGPDGWLYLLTDSDEGRLLRVVR